MVFNGNEISDHTYKIIRKEYEDMRPQSYKSQYTTNRISEYDETHLPPMFMEELNLNVTIDSNGKRSTYITNAKEDRLEVEDVTSIGITYGLKGNVRFSIRNDLDMTNAVERFYKNDYHKIFIPISLNVAGNEVLSPSNFGRVINEDGYFRTYIITEKFLYRIIEIKDVLNQQFVDMKITNYNGIEILIEM